MCRKVTILLWIYYLIYHSFYCCNRWADTSPDLLKLAMKSNAEEIQNMLSTDWSGEFGDRRQVGYTHAGTHTRTRAHTRTL